MNPEDERHLQRAYLYKIERKLLAGDPHKSNLDERQKNRAHRKIVNKRLPKLPQRIQALVDDIALLNAGGYLDAEYWSDGWDHLSDIQPQMELERESEFVEPHVWLPNTAFEEEVRFGYTIGQMIQSLTSVEGTTVDYDALCWGFLLAVFGEPRSEFGSEYRNISTFLDYATEKTAKKKEHASGGDKMMEIEFIEGDFARNKSLINDSILDDMGEILSERHRYKHSEIGYDDLEYLPFLDEIFSATGKEIERASKLKRISSKIDLINSCQSGKLSGEEVFKELWHKRDGKVDRDKFAERVNVHKKQVTEIMNNFGDNPTSEKWKTVPPLVQESPGRANKNWSLTKLGYIIGFAMFEENGIEQLNRALAQVLTDQSSPNEIHSVISDYLSDTSNMDY